jgi:hypothetical protein
MTTLGGNSPASACSWRAGSCSSGRRSAISIRSSLSSAGAAGARLRRTSTGVERVRAAGADEI